MASPWDDVRRESIELPVALGYRRASPLPWMLLAVSLSLTVGVLVLGRVRLDEERVRTANALKANDELKSKLKQLDSDLTAARSTGGAAPGDELASLKKQIVTLELERRRLQEELHKPAAPVVPVVPVKPR